MRIPYNRDAILEYLLQIFPDDFGSLEFWLDVKFEKWKQLGRKLPPSVNSNTLEGKWAGEYRNHTRGGTGGGGGCGRRVLKLNKSIQ